MNKLLWRSQIDIDQDGKYFASDWDFLPVEIFIHENVCCELLFVDFDCKREFIVHVQENAKLFCQTFFKNVDSKIEFLLESNGAEVEFVYSMVASNEKSAHVTVHHLAPNTKSVLHNSIVNYGGCLTSIQVDARVPKGCINCKLEQDNKIILIQDGKGKILPNLWIDEFDCFAEHAAYISKFSKEDLFYLQSRGISKEDADFLLTKSLLLGKLRLDDEMMTKFIEIIQSMRG